MRPVKIVFIGAGSISFGPCQIQDFVLEPALRGSTVVLVDTNAEALDLMTRFAQRLNQALDAGLTIEATTDRRQALPGADFVITSVAVDRMATWKKDFEIPLKHGVQHVLGENGGPGGLLHTLRNVPMLLDIAHDMEVLCPTALLVNFTNPESRICLALDRYTDIAYTGLCHGLTMGLEMVSDITGIELADLQGKAAGLNHFCWFLDIRRQSTGEDVYPLLWERAPCYEPSGPHQESHSLCRRLFRTFGLFPYAGDNHTGEYLPYAHEFCGTGGPPWELWEDGFGRLATRIRGIADGTRPVPEVWGRAPTPEDYATENIDRLGLFPSGEYAMPIITGMADNRDNYIPALNIRNNGCIENLPDWAVVEIPGIASADGLRGLHIGALPDACVAPLLTQVYVQSLAVDAAVKGSRELALQALLVDPVIQSWEAAEKMLDELLKVHARYLPQFTT
jgi:alpha-galactosidase